MRTAYTSACSNLADRHMLNHPVEAFEPLLADLVAADVEVPDRLRHAGEAVPSILTMISITGRGNRDGTSARSLRSPSRPTTRRSALAQLLATVRRSAGMPVG